jgi:DNA polymerase (family 10)
MIRNQEVAGLLEKIGDLLEAKDESTFRIAAYRNAAREIAAMPEDIAEIWRAGRLEEIPGVGESIASKIDEFLRTGRLAYLETLEKTLAPGIETLLAVPGLGPRRIKTLNQRLGITSLADLARAAREHRLAGLPGFGLKVEANLLREVERLTQRTQRLPLGVALPAAKEVVGLLRENPIVQRADAAGSIRRRRDTIGDVDILASSPQPAAAVDAFTHLPVVREVLARGSTRASVLAPGDLQIDFRAIPPEDYGAALLYFTGSKDHSIALREIAIRQGLKLSEYGLFDERSGRRVASATEEEIYATLGLPWIPPELRENRGEIEEALAGRLPRLIEENDLRGDLQVHTDWSDGSASIEAMVEAARARGYEYVAITDHSRGLGIAHGLTIPRVRAQRQQIDELNRRLAPFRILHSVEVNIRRDGSLDYPDDVLEQFDLVAAAVHGSFELAEAAMTARVLKAIGHPAVDVLCHPRGRLLGKREGYAIDLEAVIRAARACGVALEIDSQPDRLDLDDVWARRARDAGVTLAIDSDAHATGQLALVSYGIATARRGWVERADVLNTLPLEQLLARLRRSRLPARSAA